MIGTIQTYKGQAYEYRGDVNGRKADGTPIRLRLWRSTCADCGKPFEAMTAFLAVACSPNRRCAIHARKGVKVKTKKGAG